MVNTFFISDTHFGHSNILTFNRSDGSPLRLFSSIEEHDEHIIKCWNDKVRPQDKVYHLGDVVINRRCLPILSRLNGHKRLVRGNHDVFRTSEYLHYFEEIYGCRVLDRMIFTHIPIHPDCMSRFTANVHGHLHSNTIGATSSYWDNDMKYLNVSCEQVDYTPISIDEVRKRLDNLRQ